MPTGSRIATSDSAAKPRQMIGPINVKTLATASTAHAPAQNRHQMIHKTLPVLTYRPTLSAA